MGQNNNEMIQRFSEYMEQLTPKDATSFEEVEKDNLHTDENKGPIGSEPAAEQAGSTNEKTKNPRNAQSRIKGSKEEVEHGDVEDTVKGDYKKVTERDSNETATTTENGKSGEEKMASSRKRLGVLENTIRKSLEGRSKQASSKSRKPAPKSRQGSGEPLMDKVASDLQREMSAQYRFLLPIRQTCARDVALMKEAGVDERLARKAGGWYNLWAKMASENPDEMLPPEAAEAVKAEQGVAEGEGPVGEPAGAPAVGEAEITDEEIQELSHYLEETGASEEDVMQAIELIERLRGEGLSYQEILQLALQAGEEAKAEMSVEGPPGAEAPPVEEVPPGEVAPPVMEGEEDVIDVPLP